ncbi:MAG: hypothetical protein GEU71_11030 [Actinobacteria bacterium]|nr:hypothetical protein [Actinomycetota bacterium]
MREAPNDREAADQATKWVLALSIALVALFGVVVLVAVFVAAFEPPSWLAIMLGLGLPLAATAFAWLLASALIGSRSVKEHTPPSGVTRIGRRS